MGLQLTNFLNNLNIKILMADKEVRKLASWLIIISILAIIVSIYLTFLHYSSSSTFCNISEGLNCDVVNKSIYAEFPPGSGIPVAILGLLTFIVILIVVLKIKNNKELFYLSPKEISNYLFYLSIISILFAIYLLIIEAFFLLTFCILCIILDILILKTLIVSYKLKKVIK